MATSQESKTIPAVIPTTHQKSRTLIKQLVALAISNVAYNRALFPEEAFVDQEFDGQRIKILNSKTTNKEALLFQSWVNSALDAFEKGYLKQMIVCLLPANGDGDIVLESFKFTFNNKNDVSLVTQDPFGTKKTIEMTKIREDYSNLIRCAASMPEPEDCELYDHVRLCIKLTYNDEVTPMDYEPDGYHKAEYRTNKYLFETLHQDQGKINTGWHMMKLSTNTVKDPVNAVRGENIILNESTSTDNQTINEIKISKKKQENYSNIPPQPEQNAVSVIPETFLNPGIHTPLNTPAIPHESPDHPAVSALSKSGTGTPSYIRNAVVDCVCRTDESRGLLISCSLCDRWQHGDCYRIISEENIPENFYCFFCNDKETGNLCYDQTLIKVDESVRKEVCSYRKALVYCSTIRRINMKTFVQDLSLSDALFDKILNSLEKDNVLAVNRRGKHSQVRTVNSEHLMKVVIPKYFQECE